jgi:hypothetical protein
MQPGLSGKIRVKYTAEKGPLFGPLGGFYRVLTTATFFYLPPGDIYIASG